MAFRKPDGSTFRRIAGRSNVLRYPLRRIVKREGMLETLECGHTQAVREDFVGPTNAFRRRCWQCAREEQKR